VWYSRGIWHRLNGISAPRCASMKTNENAEEVSRANARAERRAIPSIVLRATLLRYTSNTVRGCILIRKPLLFDSASTCFGSLLIVQ